MAKSEKFRNSAFPFLEDPYGMLIKPQYDLEAKLQQIFGGGSGPSLPMDEFFG